MTIDATALTENVTIDAQQQSRVIHFSNPNEDDLTLAGLTIQNGRTTGVGYSSSGGGIRFMSEGTLALTESTLSGNSTTGDNATGGAIYSEHGVVAFVSSTLSGNSTAGIGAHGGGIFSNHGDVALASSTLSGNSTAESGARGGGIYSGTGAVTLTNSTLSGNSTAGSGAHGGGMYSEFGNVTLNQSTLAGNSTAGPDADGGGISTDFANVTLNQSTLSGNSTAGASANGGGISTNFGPVTIRNSIVAGNTVAIGSTGPDVVPDPLNTVTVNYSVIGTGITPAAGGNNFSTNVPLLGPLANNGGPTQTHALLPGSPAIEAGDNLAGAVVGGTNLEFSPSLPISIGGFTAADEYSIELVFSFDALGGYQKIIDFHDLADDTGLYAFGANLDFFGTGIPVVSDLLSANTPVHLVVTRDAATDMVVVYAEGVEIMTFVDAADIAVFSGPLEIMRFFQDDTTTGGAEAASGFVDRIRIYDRDLSAGEVAGLVFDQRGAGFDRVADGDGTPGARIDIGAYEAQVNPSADFDGDGDVDGRDFLAWQRGFGTPNAVRADGDSDNDADVDGSDLAAWQGQYGATGLGPLAAAVTAASDEPMMEPAVLDAAFPIDAAMAILLMDTTTEEVATVIARETLVSDEVFATSIEPTRVAPPSHDLDLFDLTFEDTLESEDVSTSWLSDELLECVFG